MSFSVRTVDIASNSKDLIALSAREYESDYTPLPNANLPKSLKTDLSAFFTLLTGEEMPLEENTFLIKSYEGVYSRLFGPVLKVGQDGVGNTSPDKLYVQWGPRFIPLEFAPGQVTTSSGTELDVEFSTYNFSARGEDAAMLLTIDNETEQFVLPIAVRFADWENPVEPKVLNTFLKKTPEKLLEVIQKVSSKSGGSRERIEADQEVDFKELDVNFPYEVIGYYPCKTTYGVSYRLFINNLPEEDKTSVCWAHSSIRPLLATRPEITREKPATLTLRSKTELDNGRVKIRSNLILSRQEDDPEALNLSF
jgi:hypothetical protein